MVDRQRLHQALGQIWGYDQFRYPQLEVIETLLAGRDCLVVLPTGGGKSLCFQLPALVGDGLTLVVSPLIALMEDQVQTLQRHQLPAACLHGQLPCTQQRSIFQAIAAQRLRLLYLSPETLLSEKVWALMGQPGLKIQGLMVDEAHCWGQWGDSFRPAYRRLGSLRPALAKVKPSFPIAAFTATADPALQTALGDGLGLHNPQRFRVSPFRPQLHLRVTWVGSDYCRRRHLHQFLERYRGHSGLIYVQTRTSAIALAQHLSQVGWDTVPYHGGLGSQARRQIEQDWIGGNRSFVVCTNAFGLGINKPDTRWIVHFHPPLGLMEYLQEIGRAGRDGHPAHSLTLVSEPTGWLDPGDRRRRQHFIHQQQHLQRQAQQLAQTLPPQGPLEAIQRTVADGELALAWLHRQGQLQWTDPFHYQQIKTPSPPAPLTSLKKQCRQFTQYLYTRQCRWQFILQAMGEAPGPPCGHCDNCRSPHAMLFASGNG